MGSNPKLSFNAKFVDGELNPSLQHIDIQLKVIMSISSRL